MREQMLAITAQTVYALDREQKPMADGVVPESGVGPVEQIGEARQAEKSQTEQQNQEHEARQAIGDVINEEVEKKAGKRSKKSASATAPSPREEVRAEKAKQAGLIKESDYFPQSPPSELTSTVNAFYSDIENKPLQEVSTRVLVRNYLRLRNAAKEKGIARLDFLSGISTELAERGVSVDVVIRDYEIREPLIRSDFQTGMKGGAATITEEFTDEALRNVRDAVNQQIEGLREATGEAQPVLEPEFIVDQIRRVRERMSEEPASRVEAMRLLRILNEFREEVEGREMERREGRRPGYGWYGQRLLTHENRQDIENDINALVQQRMATGRDLRGAELKGEHIDLLFNRVFDIANGLPRSVFNDALDQAGRIERTDFILELTQQRKEAVRKYEIGYEEQLPDGIRTTWAPREDGRMRTRADIIGLLLSKYGEEYKMRELLHNAFYIAETEKDFKDFGGYCKEFSSHFGDLAFLDAPEVEAALRIREQILYQIKRENNGYIPPEKISYSPLGGASEWEERSKRLLEQLNDQGKFSLDGRTPLPEWKIGRALSLSRGMGMVTLRFPEIVAEQVLPGPPETYQSQPSPPWEMIVWELNPWEFKIKKFGIHHEMRAILYAARERNKKHLLDLWSQDELKDAIAQDALNVLGTIHGSDKRMIDIRNLFKTGGPFTHTGWRPYIAALEENREELRTLLKRNPGLAMHMIFNRYENKGQAGRKWQFMRGLMRERPDLSPDERTQLWDKEKRQYEGADKEFFETEEREYWIKAAKRIPQVILRVITDKNNGLFEEEKDGQDFLAQIAREVGVGYNSKEFTAIENALTLAKENLMKRRHDALVGLPEDATREQILAAFPDDQDQLLDDVDFEDVDVGTKTRALALRNVVVRKLETDQGLQDKLIDKVANRGFPFAVTAEDVPWSEFRYGQTGPRGYFTRKINDALSVAEGNDALVELLKHIKGLQSPEQMVAQLQKIYNGVEIYDKEVAQDAVAAIATGIIRFYQKDGIVKIPIIGELLSLARAPHQIGSSYAQTVYGGRAMAWDSDDIYNFTEQVRSVIVGIDPEKQERGFGLIKQMRKETGGQWWQAIGAKTKLALYLLMLFFMYEMMSRTIKEK